MPYDPDFYTQYGAYLDEPSVAKNHAFAIQALLSRLPEQYREWLRVMDLGCGQHQEFLRHANVHDYHGIDVNVGAESGFFQDGQRTGMRWSSERKRYVNAKWLTKGNYREDNAWLEEQSHSHLDGFVSLFSTECTADHHFNQALYRKLLGSDTHLKFGLVSGFYYRGKSLENPVLEAGGIESWQTLSAPQDSECPEFEETRLILPNPSDMFGPDVYEVWRLFLKKELS